MQKIEKACTIVCISPQIRKMYHYTTARAIVDCSQNYRFSIFGQIAPEIPINQAVTMAYCKGYTKTRFLTFGKAPKKGYICAKTLHKHGIN